MYRAHGLNIESGYPLPMLLGPDSAPDLVVMKAEDRPVPEEDPRESTGLAVTHDPQGRVFYSITRTHEGVELRWPGRCLMRADEQVRHVTVHHHPGIDDDSVAVLVAGTVVALHLMLHGRLALHASAVEVEGTALAFVGNAGMGKSTVAALFARAGHPLVTDDVLHVASIGPEGAVVHRGGVELRLRDRVASLATGAHGRTTGDGRTAIDLPMSSAETLPLRACLVPRPSAHLRAVALHQLGAAEGMSALLRFPRLLGWSDETTTVSQFQLAGDLAAVTPVLVADLPWGPPFHPSIPEQVLSLLTTGR